MINSIFWSWALSRKKFGCFGQGRYQYAAAYSSWGERFGRKVQPKGWLRRQKAAVID